MHNNRGVLTLTLILLIFLVLPSVIAVPPVTTVQQFSEGYSIQVHPIKQFFAEGEDVNFHVHVFNTSNGYPINTSTLKCNFHLYSTNGTQLVMLETTTPEDLYDYEFLVRGGNFTKNTRSYHAYCYDGGIGGDYAYAIEVNNSGFLQYTSIHIIILIFFVILMVGMIMLSHDSNSEEYYDRTQESYLHKNFFKAFTNGVWYNVLNNKFALFYLLGLGVMVQLVNIIYVFHVTTLQTTFDTLMWAYSIGVIFVGVSIIGKFQEFVVSLTKDIGSSKWGLK